MLFDLILLGLILFLCLRQRRCKKWCIVLTNAKLELADLLGRIMVRVEALERMYSDGQEDGTHGTEDIEEEQAEPK